MASTALPPLPILVTGGNAGIGKALCLQLVSQHNCRVFLGSRDPTRGSQALAEVQDALQAAKKDPKLVEMVVCDVSSSESVANAAKEVEGKVKAGEVKGLYAIVNNAGTGLNHGVSDADVLTTNALGPPTVVNAFLPLLMSQAEVGAIANQHAFDISGKGAQEGKWTGEKVENARIVNVGSGSGPNYVAGCLQAGEKEVAKFYVSGGCCNEPKAPDMEEVLKNVSVPERAERLMKIGASYGLSKATLTSYTMALAQQDPIIKSKNIICSCISPGFIDTNMTKGYGAQLTPEQGTASIRHSLFYKGIDNQRMGQGWFYGSDALRSPLHFMRDPGTEPYDGGEVEL